MPNRQHIDRQERPLEGRQPAQPDAQLPDPASAAHDPFAVPRSAICPAGSASSNTGTISTSPTRPRARGCWCGCTVPSPLATPSNCSATTARKLPSRARGSRQAQRGQGIIRHGDGQRRFRRHPEIRQGSYAAVYQILSELPSVPAALRLGAGINGGVARRLTPLAAPARRRAMPHSKIAPASSMNSAAILTGLLSSSATAGQASSHPAHPRTSHPRRSPAGTAAGQHRRRRPPPRRSGRAYSAPARPAALPAWSGREGGPGCVLRIACCVVDW